MPLRSDLAGGSEPIRLGVGLAGIATPGWRQRPGGQAGQPRAAAPAAGRWSRPRVSRQLLRRSSHPLRLAVARLDPMFAAPLS